MKERVWFVSQFQPRQVEVVGWMTCLITYGLYSIQKIAIFLASCNFSHYFPPRHDHLIHLLALNKYVRRQVDKSV